MVHKLYNLKKLEEIAQGNHGFIKEMVVTFVENVSNDIGCIQSLKSAENWTAIAETSHKLASNFAYLGASFLHALAADIEKSVINERNLTGVADKTDKLCNEGILLISQLKKDFCITGV
jgi:HPt (histidine-containing phosphotransfer) domain-containing protein